MRQVYRVVSWVLLVVLISGCRAGKLQEEKSFTIPDGSDQTKIYELPAQSSEQTIKVEVTSDQPVDVYIMSAKDAPNLDGLRTEEWQTKSISFKEGVTSDTLTAKIPAKQETKVVITPSPKTQKAQVKVKMTN